MNKPLVIDYYTDILCVWAWIAQRRIDELNHSFEKTIELRHFYVDIFGDVPAKMRDQWQDRGGYQGFADHVTGSASKFEDAPVNSKIWTEVKPATSANAHLVLKAVEIIHGKSTSANAALMLRNAFFVDAFDIGDLDVLYDLTESAGLDQEAIAGRVRNGAAMAALMGDYQQSKQQGIKGSPSFVLDGGRQTLYGNVGYRLLRANIEELLNQSKDEASWC
jgi:predicted DsbA family dithiol-disulfide isomerase